MSSAVIAPIANIALIATYSNSTFKSQSTCDVHTVISTATSIALSPTASNVIYSTFAVFM